MIDEQNKNIENNISKTQTEVKSNKVVEVDILNNFFNDNEVSESIQNALKEKHNGVKEYNKNEAKRFTKALNEDYKKLYKEEMKENTKLELEKEEQKQKETLNEIKEKADLEFLKEAGFENKDDFRNKLSKVCTEEEIAIYDKNPRFAKDRLEAIKINEARADIPSPSASNIRNNPEDAEKRLREIRTLVKTGQASNTDVEEYKKIMTEKVLSIKNK